MPYTESQFRACFEVSASLELIDNEAYDDYLNEWKRKGRHDPRTFFVEVCSEFLLDLFTDAMNSARSRSK